MIYGLIARPRMELHASQNRNPLFVKLSDGSIRNSYLVKIFNKTHETRHFALKVKGLDAKEVSVQSAIPLDLANLEVTGGIVAQYRVMITAEKQPEPRRRIEISVQEVGGKLQDAATTIFVSGDEQ